MKGKEKRQQSLRRREEGDPCYGKASKGVVSRTFVEARSVVVTIHDDLAISTPTASVETTPDTSFLQHQIKGDGIFVISYFSGYAI
jgi:hypothetical protein